MSVGVRPRLAERIAARIERLLELIAGAGGFGSVTIYVERGSIARIAWSVDEKLTE